MLPTGVRFFVNSVDLPEKALPRESTLATVMPTTLFRARRLQSWCARVKSRASRKYIIYQQDAEVVNLRAFSNFLSVTHLLATLASREPQSRRTRFRSYQQVRAEGHFQFSGQRTRDQFCHKRASARGAAGSPWNGAGETRQPLQMGGRLAFVSTRSQIWHDAGNNTDVSASRASRNITTTIHQE